MKKNAIVICLLLCAICFSQVSEKEIQSKNEVKLNALFLVLGALDASYERLLSDSSGAGVSVFLYSDKDVFNGSFELTPYYRAYFGKKYASGFFVEGFSALNTGRFVNSNISISNNRYFFKEGRYVDLALGFGVGAKWVHKTGFIFEINGGIGRNFLSNNSPEVIGRGGVILGYRF